MKPARSTVVSMRLPADAGIASNPAASLEMLRLLLDAAKQGLTFVTYNRRTIPPLLKAWAEQERAHAGLIFVDEKTIAACDIGGLRNALSKLFRETGAWEWTNLVCCLQK